MKNLPITEKIDSDLVWENSDSYFFCIHGIFSGEIYADISDAMEEGVSEEKIDSGFWIRIDVAINHHFPSFSRKARNIIEFASFSSAIFSAIEELQKDENSEKMFLMEKSDPE